jgi:CYTH domain-containing protein
MGVEIERKWLVSGFPDGVQPIGRYLIKQSYLIAESDGAEVRLRECINLWDNQPQMSPYKMTIKSHGDIARDEFEIELTKEQYEKLFKQIDPNKKPIEKYYAKYEVDGRVVEISEVDGEFYYAEVEFPAADVDFLTYEFPWQEIIIEDATLDPDFKMKNYWLKTRT